MTILQNLFAFLQMYILLTAIAVVFFKERNTPIWLRAILSTLLFLLLFIPLSRAPLAYYLFGHIGNPSTLTTLLLVSFISKHLWQWKSLDSRSFRVIMYGAALFGLFYYPLALGWTIYDPYRLGFHPVYLAIPLLLFSIWGWFSNRRGAVVFLSLSIVSYHVQLLESQNLLDYLIDPLLTIYAWIWILSKWIVSILAKKQQKSIDN